MELSVIPDDEIDMVMNSAALFAGVYDDYDNGGDGLIRMDNTVLLNAYHALGFVLDNRQFETDKQRQHAKRARAVIFELIEKDKISLMGLLRNKIIIAWRKFNRVAASLVRNYGVEFFILAVVMAVAVGLKLLGVFDVGTY